MESKFSILTKYIKKNWDHKKRNKEFYIFYWLTKFKNLDLNDFQLVANSWM